VRRRLDVPFVGGTDDEFRMLLADVRADGLDHDTGHGWMLDDTTFFGFTPLADGSDSYVIATPAPDLEPTLDSLQCMVDQGIGAERHPAARADLGHRLAPECADGRTIPHRAGAARRRRGARPSTDRRPRPQHRCAGRLQLGLEARRGARRRTRRALLDSYQTERIPVAAHVLGISSELLDGYVSGAADAMERGEATQQLDLNYRSGPLALDDGSSTALAAGDRAPDAPHLRDNDPARLFELYAGPYWTLLRFGPRAPRLDHPAVQSHDVGSEILDVDDHLQRAYGAAPGTAVLVRPDGYIGAITARTDALATYAHQVLAG
jgi:hypothetical protein